MTIQLLREYSNYFQWAGSFFICIACIPLFKNRKAYIKTLFFYGLSSILFQAGQQLSVSFFNNQNINQIGNGFVFFESILLTTVFWFAVSDAFWRKWIATLGGLYVIGYIVCILFFQENSHSLIRTGREMLMIVCSVGYFFYLIRKLPEENLLKFPMFWINTAILFFFAGTFMLSLMLDYITNVLHNDLIGFWTFRNFFRFGFCLLLMYAAWLDFTLVKDSLQGKKSPVI
ncbi:MAG: hypothetical protein WAZ98_03500 [Cyclobacteriaceae bacterium]